MGQAQKKQEVTPEMVAERQNLIERTSAFAGRILTANGKTLKEEVHRYHTHMERELKDWNDFSFYNENGRSQYGGEHLKVWYRKRPVLDVCWTDIKSCTVLAFDTSDDWQEALERLLEDEAAAIAKANAEKEARRAAERRDREERDRLAEAARNFERDKKRLGF